MKVNLVQTAFLTTLVVTKTTYMPKPLHELKKIIKILFKLNLF